jgi:hypothetical protein
MRIQLTCVPTLLAAGGVAALIAAAPTAVANPLQKICVATGAGTTCQSGGHVETGNPLPTVSSHPHRDMPHLLGGR